MKQNGVTVAEHTGVWHVAACFIGCCSTPGYIFSVVV